MAAILQDGTFIRDNMSTTHINTCGGDYAGRDIHKNIYLPSAVPVSRLRRLFEQFEKEKQSDPNIEIIAEELQHLMTPRQGEVVIGLEEKLKIASKPQETIDFARECKEQYAKKLYKQQFYSSSQQINLILLSTARNRFINYVYPLITQGRSDEEVARALDEYVVKHLLAMLEADDCFVFTLDDVWGIIYFLTGNCYIKWV